MPIRYRKSKKVAPGVKVNVGKKSTSVTFGEKGVHTALSSTGRRTSSVGVPGTGVSYTKTTGSSRKKSSSRKSSKSIGCFTEIFIFIILLFVLVGIFSGGSDKDGPSSKSVSSQSASSSSAVSGSVEAAVSQSAEPSAVPTDPPVQEATMYVTSALNVRSGPGTDAAIVGELSPGSSVSVKSIDGDWAKIVYNGVESYVSTQYLSESAPTSAPSSEAPNTPSQQNATETYILNTNTHKFHSSGCSSVKQIKPENYATSSSSRDDLISQGYEPCKKCNP